MSQRNTVVRALHDLGLAAWFGGSLMGAVGVNGAAAEVDDPRQRARVANAGWARWTPVNLAAIAVHLAGGAGVLSANRARVRVQPGVAWSTAAKTGLTVAALGATAYARVLGQKVMDAGDVAIDGGTEPSATTPPVVAGAQQQLKVLQWVIPALTGGVVVLNALHGEQQAAPQRVKGIKGLRKGDRTAVREGVNASITETVADALKSSIGR